MPKIERNQREEKDKFSSYQFPVIYTFHLPSVAVISGPENVKARKIYQIAIIWERKQKQFQITLTSDLPSVEVISGAGNERHKT